MAVTATSVTGTKLAGFRAMLGKSATLQGRVSVESGGNAEAAALRHVYLTAYILDEPGEEDLPACILEADAEFGWRQVARGSGDTLFPYGAVTLTIIDRARFESDIADGEADYRNFAEGVLQDLAAAAGDNTNPDIVSIDTIKKPQPGAIGRELAAWESQYRIRWGAA